MDCGLWRRADLTCGLCHSSPSFTVEKENFVLELWWSFCLGALVVDDIATYRYRVIMSVDTAPPKTVGEPAPQKKRKDLASAGKKPTSKRRKVQATRQLQPKKTKRRPVAVDALPWRTVDVPEMFNDAEGFYGLEEVEGVEVVRKGNTVEFVGIFLP